ncbi:phosphotransferase [Ornithinimicrobium avium]|nr:phosphotransferase [Ornithinimicrobium avium]
MRSDLALAALASAAVPGMKPVSVAGIGLPHGGYDHDLQTAVVEDATGRRWTVRAPLTPVAGARLQRNDELVRQLARHVPFKVPAAVGYASLGKDGSAAVYPYVDGSPLDLHRLPAGPGLASAVGRALAAIHNITRGVFEEQDVPIYDAAGARQRIIAEVDRAAETGRVPTGLLARWEEAFDAAPMWQFAPTPVHGRFTGDSVLVAFTDDQDAASGRVVAVTDWDEAMVGDPAVDLAELRSHASPEAWEAVLESYTLARAHRPDPYLHARARLVAELRHLRGLARAVAEDDEAGARRAVESLRRADRLTEADDSLVPVTARPSGATAGHRPVGAVVPAGEPADRPDPDVTMEVPLPEVEDVHGERTPADDAVEPIPVIEGEGDEQGWVAQGNASAEEAGGDGQAGASEDVPDAPDTVTAGEPVEGDNDPETETDPGAEPATGTVLGAATDLGAATEPAAWSGTGDEPSTDDAGHEQVMHGRTPGDDDEGARHADAADEEAVDDEEDAQRLHELYGMPDPAQDGGDR